jgi:hypothetical protein
MRRLTFALAILPLLTPLFPAQAPDEDVRFMTEAGVPTDPAGLTAWIKRLHPSADTRQKAEQLIPQLGDAQFEVREKASAALLRLGPSVLPVVRKARDSTDPEISRRAKKCVLLLERRAASRAVVAAAVRRLETVATAEAALALLDLFGSVGDEVPLPDNPLDYLTGDRQPLVDQVRASLVRMLRRSPRVAEQVRTALGDKLPARRCAAAAALLLADTEGALPKIRELLEDGDRGVRLGVARALALRRHRQSVPVLIALVEGTDGYAALAEDVLFDLAGDDPPRLVDGDSTAARRKRREAWQSWWEKNRGRADVFEWLAAGKVERFRQPAKDVTAGYRSFVHEATVPDCKAEVRGGRLHLRGDHEQGDQRLVITARKVTGRAQWPDALDVAVKLGGTGEDNISWHIGVSVGRVKVLFHPNFEEGALRAETFDTHEHFFENTNMGFTPAPDVMHEMTIRVRRTDRGYSVEVTVVDGKGGGRHQKHFEVSREQMGAFDRVGLERSGRRGGDALFEMLSIKRGR